MGGAVNEETPKKETPKKETPPTDSMCGGIRELEALRGHA
jgi:hypothetical protein